MEKIVELISCESKISARGSEYCACKFKEENGNVFPAMCWTPELIKGRAVGTKIKGVFGERPYNGRTSYDLNSVEVLEVPASKTTQPKSTGRVAGYKPAKTETNPTEEPVEEESLAVNEEENYDPVPDNIDAVIAEKESPSAPDTYKDIPVKKWENPKYVVKDGFRPFHPNEIKVIAAKADDNEAKFILLVDLFVYEKLLNEKFGMSGWQINYPEGNDGYARCSLQIKVDKTWITKEGIIEHTIGPDTKRSNDYAFRRACRAIGLGDELWTTPTITVSARNLKLGRNDKGKTVVLSDMFVNDIEYDESKAIVKLEIAADNKVIYSYDKTKKEV